MEAKVEKKPMEGKFKTWKMRYWRIKDRRLIHYNKSCTEWSDCVPKNKKLDIDLALMSFASFYPKTNPKPNLLQIKHPKIGNMLLRFNADKSKQDTMSSWLKVLTAWGVDRKNNRIYVAIPSNYSYAMWTILSALYDHPDLTKTEGVFRKESTNIRVKWQLCSDLLYETLSINDIKSKYNDVILLSKSLQFLLINMPSSIFGDQNFEDLLDLMKRINVDPVDENDFDKNMKSISLYDLNRLKALIERLFNGSKHIHRYGLISLILHLCKQITMNEKENRMTCHAMARLFAMCFESKQYMQNSMDPFRSLLFVKVLIYHSYFLFPKKEWKMKQIVIAEKQEKLTMVKYRELTLSKKQKNNRLKKMVKPPPTKNYDGNMKINNIKNFTVPSIPSSKDDDNDNNTDDDDNKDEDNGTSTYKQKQKEKLAKLQRLNRYKSHDDLDIGGLEAREHDVQITNMIKEDEASHPNRFAPVHTKQHKAKQSSNSLSKHFSYSDLEDIGNGPSKPQRQRSASVPNIIIPQIESPRMTKRNGWAAINQTKIAEFNEPCYYNDGQNECIYFICNASKSTNRQCWKYNITFNQYRPFVIYPQYLRLLNYTVSCDQNGQRLFIIGSNTQFAELMNINNDNDDDDDQRDEYVWNEKTAQIYCDQKMNKEMQQKYDLILNGDDPSSLFIGSEIGELHVIGGKLSNYHLRWDEHDQKMIKLHKFTFSGIQGHNMLYVRNEWNKELKSKLLLLGGYTKFPSERSYKYSDQILCCDIVESSNQCTWNPLNSSYSTFSAEKDKIIKLPKKLAYFGAVIYKNIFVIIFGGRTEDDKKLNDIYYLNLNTMKWKQSSIKCPIKGRGYYAILTNDNMIHLFQRDASKHFSVKVSDIIPDQVVNKTENQQETAYKMSKIQKKSTLEIERQKEFYNSKSSSIRSVDSMDGNEYLSPLNESRKSTKNSDTENGSQSTNLASPYSTSLSATPTPATYDPNQSESKQDEYSAYNTPNTPNTANTSVTNTPITTPQNNKKRKSESKKKSSKKEHVPIFSDDEEANNYNDKQKPPIKYDNNPSNTNDIKQGKGYHLDDLSNDVFYNEHSSMVIKKRRSSSKKKKQRSNNYPVNPVNYNDNHPLSGNYSNQYNSTQFNSNQFNSNQFNSNQFNSQQFNNNQLNNNNEYYDNQYSQNMSNYQNMNNNDNNNNNRSTNLERFNNHRITRQDIDNDRFSCKIMYDWFAALCGPALHPDPPQTQTLQPQTQNDRVPSNSYHEQLNNNPNPPGPY